MKQNKMQQKKNKTVPYTTLFDLEFFAYKYQT